jgi:hypothetical protein
MTDKIEKKHTSDKKHIKVVTDKGGDHPPTDMSEIEMTENSQRDPVPADGAINGSFDAALAQAPNAVRK